MPARRDWTLEEFQAQLERRREQTRLRVARYREKRSALPVTVTAHSNGVAAGYPPQTPPSPSLSKEREKIRAALAPFVARGYAHSDRYWELAAEEYPLLRLELEALKLADWLLEPKNAKKLCSTRRIDNWLKTAEADRVANQDKAAAQRNGNSAHTNSGNGTYYPPITQQHNRQPDAPRLLEGELVPISRVDFERYKAERRAIPLEQRAAQLKGPVPEGAKP